MKKLTILFVHLILITGAGAQNLQLGLSPSVNSTFFQKGRSSYEQGLFTGTSKSGLGFSVPAFIKINGQWGIRTGLGTLGRVYQFEQTKYDFPGVVEKNGAIFLKVENKATEIPLLLCYSPGDTSRKIRIEAKIGCVLSYNRMHNISLSANDIEYHGIDSVHRTIIIDPDSKKFLSPDIYFGIGLIKMSNGERRHELTLSYQYGFSTTARFGYLSVLWNPSETRSYFATVRPNLSYLALTYTFYPGLLNMGREGNEDTGTDAGMDTE
jgi:hypothetical protein